MNEQFDHDLREAIKQGPGGSLKGLEFTPAMRQRVLDRIRTEAPGSAVRPSRPVRTVPRPLLWAAVAAAAMVIAIRIDGVQGFLGFQSSASKTSSPMMAGSAQESSAMKAESTASAPAMPAPAPSQTAPSSQDRSTAGSSTASAPSGSAGEGASMKSSAASSVAQAAAFISLAPPPAQEAAPRMAPAPAAAVPAPSLSMKPAVIWGGVAGAGSRVLLIGEGAVAAHDAAGRVLWQSDLPGVSPTSATAVAEDGRSAVAGADTLYVLTSSGEVERKISVAVPVTRLALGPDGQLAVVAGNRLSLDRNGEMKPLAEGVVAAEVRFRADGAIALLATANGQRTLRLWDAEGSLLFETPLQRGGRGLALTSAGQILAGGTVFDSRGRAIGALPVDPLGIEAPQGAAYAILWTGDQVVAVNPGGGAVLWRAHWEGGGSGIRQVVVGWESGAVAVAGALEQGGGIFVLNGASGEVRLAERVPAPPTGMQIAGSRLFLTIDGGLDQREIGQ